MREDQRQIENAHSAGEKHCTGDRLHRKLQIGTCTPKIVVNAKTKNEASRNINAKESCRSDSRDQAGKNKRERQPHAQADGKSQEYRDASQTWKWRFVNVPSILRHVNPPSAGCQVSHFTRSYKRQSQRERK